ncbi:glutamine amidotransferase [Desulfuromonas soudanensis]|uniref:Glutamine amidotransferase n=1 Tax=Desulfuromonas soudanensis TaxID=1603606 RepID=A0A0M5ILC7_9BACT|nr:type 1 glutamine amidotransferase [Desulfuromonas soudanensis]ALC17268.1 glutamine amidotransferase [Desulfuromonas soudanensis]
MLLVIQNDPRVPPAFFGTLLMEWGIAHRVLRLFAGDPMPDSSETSAVIVLGGTMGVHDREDFPFLEPLSGLIRDAADIGTPLLGICLGGQLLAHALGGEVHSGCRGEKGLQRVKTVADDPLFAGLPPSFYAFQWHNDSFSVPPGAAHLAVSEICPGQAFRYRNTWGVQFHPEVDRATVAAWSATVDPEGLFAERFAAGEKEHRELARRILGNFLAVSALRKPFPATKAFKTA